MDQDHQDDQDNQGEQDHQDYHNTQEDKYYNNDQDIQYICQYFVKKCVTIAGMKNLSQNLSLHV